MATRGTFETRLAASQEAVFAFHERPDAFRLLTPWWSGARVVRAAPSLLPGQRSLIRLGVGPLGVDWEARHVLYDPPRRFDEYQVRGPFVSWRHRHLILADGAGAILRDEIEFQAPGGLLAPLLDRLLLRPFLQRLFAYRHAVTRREVEPSFDGRSSAAPAGAA